MKPHIRPLRPFFYKPVALFGVPLYYWKIPLAATVISAIGLFIFWRNLFGIPLWFVGSLALGLGLVMFFLWAHNAHHRGWLEYSLRYWRRELTGAGNNFAPEKAGRSKQIWLLENEPGDNRAGGINSKSGKRSKTINQKAAGTTAKWLD